MTDIGLTTPARIRRVTMDDWGFIISLAEASYGVVDGQAIRNALGLALMTNGMFLCRSDHAFGGAVITAPIYNPGASSAHMAILMADRRYPMAGFRMLRAMADWAKYHGVPFHFGSSTNVDFTAAAARLGAARDNPSFTIPA